MSTTAHITFESSAKQGYHVAQYRLGKMICEGGYYRRVPENAEYWLLLSAKQNNPYAEALLGRLYLTGDFYTLTARRASIFCTMQYAMGTLTLPIRSANITPTESARKRTFRKLSRFWSRRRRWGDIYAEYRLAQFISSNQIISTGRKPWNL